MVVEVRHEPRRGRKVLLVSLRVATALLAWAVAVQPRWIGERTEQVEGRLAVLFDASRSMTLPRGEEARARRAQALAARWASASRLPVATFSFGERLATADMSALGERYAAQDDQSRLGAALASLLALYSYGRFAKRAQGEPSHALAHVCKLAPSLPRSDLLVMNMCGRGDKDIFAVAGHLGMQM